MPTLTLRLPALHQAQQKIKHEARRFNVVCCGRRFGKDVLGHEVLIEPALDSYPVAWFAPTYKMLSETWRDVLNIVQPITKTKHEQERRIDLITGGVIDMWSLDDPNVARGRKYKRVVINEAAMIRHLQEAWQQVIRPTLADYEGDAWFPSTPKGLNFFHSLYLNGQDELQPDWVSWQLPTYANPFIKPGEIEEMRRTLPERVFNQEIMAQFINEAGGVFRKVLDAAIAQPQPAQLGRAYVMGVDFGKQADFTVLTVLDVIDKRMVALDRFNQIDYTVQTGRIRALYEKYKPSTIIAERNSMGEPLIEQLQREGLPVQAFTTTNASKAQAIDALALAFERGELTILNDAVLIGELQAYEAERLPSGMLRYSAPDGMHDDTVMSLALAWYGIAAPQPRVRVLG